MDFFEFVNSLPIAIPAVLMGLFGLAIGSFLNVVIYRVPRAESIAWPSSHCPQCKTPIKPWENIPVLSYLFLQGRCKTCGWPIKVRYPIVEMAGAIIALLPLFLFGAGWDAIGGAVLGWHLLAIAVIDFETKTIPDHIVLPLALFGVIFTFLRGGWAEVKMGLIAAAIVGVFFGIIWIVSRVVRGSEGLGTGDITMSVGYALYLRPMTVILSVIMAAFIGLTSALLWAGVKKEKLRGVEIPFGPSLAIAAWIMYLFGGRILEMLLSLYFTP